MLKVLLTFALSVVSIAYAATPMEDVLQSFAGCNGDFFRTFGKNIGSMSKLATIMENGKAASFAVENRLQSGKQDIIFSKPILVFGVHLLGYHDEAKADSSALQSYRWGFLFKETPAEVYAHLRAHIKKIERLTANPTGFALLEEYDGNKWVDFEFNFPQRSSARHAGAQLTRVLYIDDVFPGSPSRLSCLLNGPVDDTVLADLRPDLKPEDYPRPPRYKELSFESVPLDSDVQKMVSTLLKGDALRPKFKKATFRFRMHTANRSPNEWTLVETYQVSEDGLLRRRENYSTTFYVDRLMLWNLVQIKSKMSSDSEVSLTHALKVRQPEKWEAGQTLEIETSATSYGENEITTSTHDVCIVGNAFPAREIYTGLSGSAIKIACADVAQGTSAKYAFVGDLGIFIKRSYTSKWGDTEMELVDINADFLERDRSAR